MNGELIIDPNSGINENSGYLDIDKLSIDFKLSAIKKQRSAIIAEGNSAKILGDVKGVVDFMQGNQMNDDKSYALSTLFTEANSSFDVIENGQYKDLGTLGIKDANIDFNSSNVPIVTMTLVDVRGQLFQQGNASPFAVFFELPYPIFQLTAKGFVGNSVTYYLHLYKFNSSFNSDFGGFEIKCEFIGYNYAFLSDMLIGYLKAAPYTNIGGQLMVGKDTTTTFSGLREQINKLNNEVNNFRDNQSQIDVDTYGTVINELESLSLDITLAFERLILQNPLINSDGSLLSSNSVSYMTFTTENIKEIEDELIKTISSFVDSYNAKNTDFGVPSLTSKNNYDILTTLTNPSIEIIDDNGVMKVGKTNFHQKADVLGNISSNVTMKGGGYGNDGKVRAAGEYPVKTFTIKFLLDEINAIVNSLSSKLDSSRQIAAADFDTTITTEGIKMSIGYYFNVICNHIDVFMQSIAEVAKKAETSGDRKSSFKDIGGLNGKDDSEATKILAFPEYKTTDSEQNGGLVETWIGKALAPGKTIPEVEFVDQLIRGMLKARQDDKNLEKFLEPPVGVQVTPFTPIHPLDTLNTSSDYHPYRELDTATNVDDLIKLISYRMFMFLSTQNISKELPEDILQDLVEVELANINEYLSKNDRLMALVKTSSPKEILKNKKISERFTYTIAGNPSPAFYYPKISDNGAFSNKKNILQSTSIDYSQDNFVMSENFAYSSTKQKRPIGYYSGDKFRLHQERTKPIKLSEINTSESETSVAPNVVLDSTGSDYNINTIMGSKFTANLGYSKITSFNGNASQYAFYKYPNFDANSCNLRMYGDDMKLFGSPLYMFQLTNEQKAMIFLLSSPIGFRNGSYGGNLSENIDAMLSGRTGMVRGSMLWCAMIGGIFKLIKKQMNICLGRRYTMVTNGNSITRNFNFINENLEQTYVGADGNVYWKVEKQINGVIEYVIPIKDESSGELPNQLEFGSMVLNSENYVALDPFFTNANDYISNQFIGIFDKFVTNFTNDIINTQIDRIYKPEYYTFSNFVQAYGGLADVTNNASKGAYFNLLDLSKSNTFEMPKTKGEVDKYMVVNFEYFGGDNKRFIGYTGKIKSGSKLYSVISSYVKSFVDITIYNANMWSTIKDINKTPIPINESFTRNSIVSEVNVNKLENLLVEGLNNLASVKKSEDAQNISESGSALIEVYGTQNSDDIRLKVYKDIKAIYDKWICGNPDYLGSKKESLYESFRIVNRTYQDISELFKVNLYAVTKDLNKNLHQPIYGHLSKVLGDNNFNFLPMPNYVDLSDPNNVKDMFLPRYYNESQNPIKPTFMCMYIGEYSSKLDLGANANFRSDGIEMVKIGGVYQHITANDFASVNGVPIVIVRFGDSNQSIFKSFKLDQSDFSATNEALQIIEGITKENGLGQNLFDIYSVRSYNVTIECLGNLMLQPFMYFYLEGIPMFGGLYFITKVSHNITANSITTTIKASRMRNTMTKMVDIESLYYSLFQEISSTNRSTKASNGKVIGSRGALYGQGYNFSVYSPFASNISSKIENTTGVNIAANQNEPYALPEVKEFIYEIGKKWYDYTTTNNINSPRAININGVSMKYGVKSGSHKSHQLGTSIDIRPITNRSTDLGGTVVGAYNYSESGTKELVRIIHDVANMTKFKSMYKSGDPIYAIYFNDPTIQSQYSKVTSQPGHNNHLHLEIRLPDKYISMSTEGGFKPTSGLLEPAASDKGVGDKVLYNSVTKYTNNADNYLEYVGKIPNYTALEFSHLTPRVKAILDVISFAEGTMGRGLYNGYDLLVGSYGKTQYVMNQYTTTGNVIVHRGKKGTDAKLSNWSIYINNSPTGAAGRYQILYDTWKGSIYNLRKHYGTLPSDITTTDNERNNLAMSQKHQDMVAGWIFVNKLRDYGFSESNLNNINSAQALKQLLSKFSPTWEAFKYIDNPDRPIISSSNLFKIFNTALSKY